MDVLTIIRSAMAGGYSARREGGTNVGTGGDGHHARLRAVRDANA
jgi:hypothetical protein